MAREIVVALNPEAERLFGWAEAELLGEPLDRLIPPRFRQLTELRPTITDESPGLPLRGTQVRLSAQRRDGTEFPVELTHCPLGSPAGTPLPWSRFVISPDGGSAQETLFREKEQASVTLASIADAVITTDRGA